MKKIIAATTMLALAGCVAPATVRQKTPPGTDVGVIAFRDCTILDQEDCNGSGVAAGSVMARALAESSKFKGVPLSRPVGAKDPLDDAKAAEYGKSKGYAYVVNGEVQDYYRVAPMTFRSERAAISLRVLRTSDGAVVTFFQDHGTANNFRTPDGIIQDMCKKVVKAM